MQRDRCLLVLRLLAGVLVLGGAIYCLITLRDPIPALSRTLEDRHAYFATTLLVFLPCLVTWHLVAVVATWRRARAAVPYAAISSRRTP